MKRFEEDTMKPWDIGEIERMGFVKEEMSSGERDARDVRRCASMFWREDAVTERNNATPRSSEIANHNLTALLLMKICNPPKETHSLSSMQICHPNPAVVTVGELSFYRGFTANVDCSPVSFD
ncbi:hypothetical protein DY000_02010516 [Brassica cretica]|uniref:Uncharacterized protein n=1 Tax=Brassica cretica TaxID=69181 RepID=A0ABQ7CCI2_BRACR|nr:hypothetical protein DY000_02010516 [Brassica cretica]